jgi:serine/threonine protein kinase
MVIAKGTARGLAHLHDDASIVHGNLTASNVLLDDDSGPKIADIGLSRLMTAAANSSVLAAAGALGYRAPELSKLKKASAKTDVYSLGVIILELLTGKSPADTTNGMDLPQWVASIVKEEWTSEVFDLELMRDAAAGPEGDELMDTLKLALQCAEVSPSARPEAREVLRQLEEIRPGPEGGAEQSDEGHVVASASNA